MKTFQGAIFDLDGTLFDSMGMWAEIDKAFFARRGRELPPQYPQEIKTMSFRAAAEHTARHYFPNETPEAFEKEWTEMTQEYYANEVALKPYAAEYLHRLHAQGIKLAVATSNRRELFIPTLKRCGVYELFSAFVTTEDVGRSKEFPEVYLEAAKQLNLSANDCAVFEDVLTAVKCAHGAGFYTVAVADEYSAHEEEQLRRTADESIRSYRELLS